MVSMCSGKPVCALPTSGQSPIIQHEQNCLMVVMLCACAAVDMKIGKAGEVYEGQPRGGKADCTLTIDDENFMALHAGKLAPQQVGV